MTPFERIWQDCLVAVFTEATFGGMICLDREAAPGSVARL
jgi:hypothetical protein